MTTFLIYTYREPALLGRLVNALEPHRVLIHVDAKVDERPFRDAIASAARARARFIEDRGRVNWGGFSQVVAIRKLVREALQVTADDEYIVMLSGQDYPIRPMRDLDALFAQNPGKQYLRYFEVAGTEAKFTDQVDRVHHRDLRFLDGTTQAQVRRLRSLAIRMVDQLASPFRKPVLPPGLRVTHGPTHFAMTASFARYLESRVTPGIEEFFRGTFCPEEKFYQSLAASSPRGGETGGPLEGGCDPFEGWASWCVSNLHVIDRTLVRVFTDADWEEIVASKKYFLRKLEFDRSRALLDRIDRELLGIS